MLSGLYKMENTSCCEGCGLLLPDIQGPTHEYMLSSPACWKMYGEVLAREYSDQKYFEIHRLTLDAYAVQHPGNQDRRAIQWVNIHLASLYLIFNENYSCEQATRFLGECVKHNKNKFEYLERPFTLGDITVLDVWKSNNAEQHIFTVKKWARFVFDAWGQYHDSIKKNLKDS
jgi:hypothetical protein